MKHFFVAACVVALYSTSVLANNCSIWLAPTESEQKALRKFLTPSVTSEKPTVHFERLDSNGEIVFVKDDSVDWYSNHKYIEDSLTRQFDPRAPIFIFGPALSLKLRFKIERRNDHEVELRAPGADLLGRLLTGINHALKKSKKEPVSYLPLSAGLVDSAEALALSLSVTGDFKLGFPFADNDFRLTGHEVAFHLGGIIFRMNILERAAAINRHTLEFAKFLKKREHELGPVAQKIIEHLLRERSLEFDAGSANFIGHLSIARSELGMASYRETLSKFKAIDYEALSRFLDCFYRPQLQPIEALIARLNAMTGVDPHGLINRSWTFNRMVVRGERPYGDKIALTNEELAALKHILVSYFDSHLAFNPEKQFQLTTPREELIELMNGFDERIADISAAYDDLVANPSLLDAPSREPH